MTIKIFTMPFSQDTAGFFEEELNNFMLKKNIKIIQPAFFESGSERYWSVFVEYENIILDHEEKTKKSKLPELDKSQKLLLDKLFEVRRELADKDGVPVFIIASNKQLADIVLKMPQTHEQLKEINGFGSKKIKKYGQEIIEIVKVFYNSKSEKTINPEKNE
ncbi:MAG: HRDC domain-containing protein [Desulfobacula sp.]|nr:HRDC domain-containing protein [Desulfobacula sp.]